jgi:hypothetical protein
MPNNISMIEERWIWLSSSVALAVLAAWIRWFISRPTDDAPNWLLRWQRWWGRPWIEELTRLAFMVGIPAVALLWRGVLTERGLGFQPLLWPQSSATVAARQVNWQNWVTDIGWTLGVVTVTGLILGLGTYQQRRLRHHKVKAHHELGTALREAIHYESHWAFYREPFVLLWGPQIGSWMGLLPALIEALLNPQLWDDLQTFERGRNVLVRTGTGVMSALVFVNTQNIWCALAADILLSYAMGTVVPHSDLLGAHAHNVKAAQA